MLEAGRTGILSRMLLIIAVFTAFAVNTAVARSADPFIVDTNIAYGPANEQRGSNMLDVYVPRDRTPSSSPLPVFVWIHGGGWFRGDKQSSGLDSMAKTMVRAGYVYVAINYRLSPELDESGAMAPGRLRFPYHHKDAARAIGWVNQNIAGYGGDPDRILLGGSSAGGQIASLLGTRPVFLNERGVSLRQIRGVVALDAVGLHVPRMMTPAYRDYSSGFQRMMFNAFATPAEERQNPVWLAASPIHHADPTDPPFFHVIPARFKDRWQDAERMAGLLKQR